MVKLSLLDYYFVLVLTLERDVELDVVTCSFEFSPPGSVTGPVSYQMFKHQ